MGWHTHLLLCLVAGLLGLSNGQGENKPPIWDKDSLNVFLQGISEDTAIGTSLGQLRCTDPEGDPIFYSLSSGTVVKVAQDGVVTLDVLLDFEKTDNIAYDLEFACVDVDRNTGRFRHAQVNIKSVISPNDANDNAPEFSVASLDGYSFFISEDEAVGTILSPQILISDKDRSSNAVLDQLYLICDSPNEADKVNLTETSRAACEKFTLNLEQRGEGEYASNLTLKSPLDFESRRVYSTKLIAIDGGVQATRKLTTSVNIQINVQDAQDVGPIFTNLGSSASVNEKAPIGSTVSGFGILARDGDFGDKRPVKLTVIDDVKDAFNLSETRLFFSAEGIYESKLIVNNQLDRESIATAYEFTVKVTELDKDTLAETDATATATYSVFITDSNDNPPLFSQDIYYVNVTELNSLTPVQINGFRVDCNDPDELSNARYNVRVVSQSFPAYSITPSVERSGKASMFLQVDNPSYLDYDNPLYREQRVVLEAKEVGTAELLSSTTVILISLKDINDNAPKFDSPSYTISISESIDNFPYNFLNVSAADKDSGDNGRVKYRLEGETAGLFRVQEDTGSIFLDGPVDYETTSQYVFLVYAYDQAETQKQKQVQVTVNILNFNDEGPKFLLPAYQTSVNESSLVFFNPVKVTAVDNEDGSGRITYRIVGGQSPNNAFVIDPNTGELTLRDTLNFEETPVGANGKLSGKFTVEVEASDNGAPPQTNTVSILINVIDVNDHSPVLNPRTYTVELSELAPPGQFITQVKGTDDDSGDFGTIQYRISQGLSDNFLVDSRTGKITVGANRVFNYDVQDRYTLQVIASDGGAPQKSATATVYITILDGNNQAPKFQELLYYVTVDEKEPVGSVVEEIKAIDTDSTAKLEYSILPFPFRASDPDGKTLSATSAYDFKNAFGVNNNGGIFVKNQLDRDSANEISFTLQVQDVNTEEGSPTATTQVTMLITGKASTNITFDRVTTVYMNENAEVGYNAITVTARDPNNNAVQNYQKLSQPGTSSNFDVTSNGRITLTTPIDYENDPQADHLHRIVVRAVSNDRLQSATTTATVSIVDVNDNPPVFQPRYYEAEVPETFTYPMEVVSVFATDVDSSSYGPLEFRISGGLDADDFMIFPQEPNAGSRVGRRAAVIVSPGTELDFNRRSEYNLDIAVVDNVNTEFSSAQLSTNAKLIIKVIDENNNSPIFVESSRTLAVPETAELGQSIATLIATDKDVGMNGDISYALEATSQMDSVVGLQLFSITPRTGTVQVKQSLLGLGGKVYHMLVRARDRGDRPNTGYMQLNITVQSTEDDDGNPKWILPVNGYIVRAPEETPNYVLTDVNGRSQFFNVNPRTGTGIQYALSPVGEYAQSFRINATTGEITIVDSLDRERQEFYNLLVYAEDTSNPVLIRSGRQLIVQLTDINDNEPTFTNPKKYDSCVTTDPPLELTVKENTVADATVYVLTACDPDLGQAAQIRYELYNQIYQGSDYCRKCNEESILRLNSSTGELTTKYAVDYEQRQEYCMCIRALPVYPVIAGKRKKRSFDLDQVDQSLHSVAYIHIAIQDENDNGPRFPQREQVAVVHSQPGTGPVVTLLARDLDGPSNNVVLYRVMSSVFVPKSGSASDEQAAPDVFKLRGASGALYPGLQSYQSFSGGRFVLIVRAIDQENPNFYDDIELVVYVYEDGQAMKVILGDRATETIVYSSRMIRELDQVSSRYSFKYLQLSEHRTDDNIEPDKTDVCFLAVDETENSILNVRQVISLLENKDYKDVLSQDGFNQVDRGLCYPSKSSEKDVRWRNLWWVLVAVAIFIFVCCVILIVLVVLLYRKYRRYMKTRQTYLVGQ